MAKGTTGSLAKEASRTLKRLVFVAANEKKQATYFELANEEYPVNLVDVVEQDYANANVKNHPSFRSGDTVVVHARITEGSKSRIQLFQGMVISVERRAKIGGHFRVRKVSAGYGVERVFPFHSPNVEKIEVVQRGKSRQSKLFYLRDRSGKSARVAIDYERKE